MAEFDVGKFVCLLQTLPERQRRDEPPEHSEYLQKNVFDILKAGKGVDLRKLDWDAFDLRHLALEWQCRSRRIVYAGWLEGINSYVHETPSCSENRRRFF